MSAETSVQPVYTPHQRQSQPPSLGAPLVAIIIGAAVLPAILAYTLSTGSEFAVLAVVLAAVAVFFILGKPFWGLVLLLGLIYTRPEESVKGMVGMRLSLMVSLVTLVGMWFAIFSRGERLTMTSQTGMLLGFTVFAILSTVGNGSTSMYSIAIIRLVVVALMVLNLARTPERFRTLISALLVFTAYLAVYSIILYLSGQALVLSDENFGDVRRSKATGIFSDPNDLAATFVAGLGLALSRVTQARNRARPYYLLLCALFIGAILLTNSRGGLLAMVAVCGGFFLTFSKRKTLATVMAVIVGVGLFGITSSRMRDFNSGEESANRRFWFWTNGVMQLQWHPILGVGFGSFPDLNEGMVAHNSFVQCFAETGFVGYFFFMGCIYYAFRRRPEESAPEEGVALADGEAEATRGRNDLFAARLALFGYLAACFWITRLYTPVLYMLIALPGAGQLAMFGRQQRAPDTRARHVDWARIVLICIGSVLFIKYLAAALR